MERRHEQIKNRAHNTTNSGFLINGLATKFITLQNENAALNKTIDEKQRLK